MELEAWVSLAVGALWAWAALRERARRLGVRVARWRRQRRLPDDPAEAARRAYVDGEIDEQELEYRLAVAFDPDRDRVQSTVEQAHGVGPATSAALRERFETVDAIQAADRDQLADVPGVGQERAAAIRELFDGS